VVAREPFRRSTGHGEWADSLAELDADFGALLDLLDELAIASDTIVLFAGDNGPDDLLLWGGSAGYWEGSYFAGGEGNLRTPCIVRWPGHVRAGQVSDEIMHVTDWFTTLLHAAGTPEPEDRVIDGIDQLDWLTGAAEHSRREGYVYWMGPEIYGVKWRNFKLSLYTRNTSATRLESSPRPRSSTSPSTRRNASRTPCRTCTPGPPPTSTGYSTTSRPASGASP
jgi:arylsulfatase